MRLAFTPSVSFRLMAVCGLAVATTVATGWIGGSGMLAADDSVRGVLGHLSQLDELKQAHVELLTAILFEHETFTAANELAQQGFATDALVTIDTIDMRLTRAAGRLASSESAEALESIRRLLPTWRDAVDGVTHASAADPELIIKLTKADGTANDLMRLVGKLTTSERSLATQAAEQATDTSKRARIQLVITAVLGALLCFAGGYFIARGIIQPLRRSVAVLEAVATGDFTRTLDHHKDDELGTMANALNGAIGSIHGALNEVREAAEAVASASYELTAAGDQISSGAQEQASSLEETSASLAEMTATVKQNAENAAVASAVAKDARGVADQGGQTVNAAVAAMAEINVAAKKIGDIVGTIDEIAFQTNLLALNAAVEAARAGDQGRGFAVVAAEVRSLAQRSATSAKEIRNLIKDSLGKVENGSNLVHRSGESLREVVIAVERMSGIVEGIALASRDQAIGIDQLNRTVSQMDKVTQANAAQTEELSGTAQSMSSQADQLRHLVGRFRLRRASDGQAPDPDDDASETAMRSIGTETRTPRERGAALARLQDGEEAGLPGFGRTNHPEGEFHEF